MNTDDVAEISDVNRLIVDNLTASAGGHSWTYDLLCGIYCNDSNALIIEFIQVKRDNEAYFILLTQASLSMP